MIFQTVRALADRAALFTALRQDQLRAAVDELDEHRWDVDLAAGTMTFTSTVDPSRTLTAAVHLVASVAPGPRSLMWSWALPQGDRAGLTERLRAYGLEHGVPELIQGEVPFPDDTGDDLDAWVAELARVAGGAATEITGLSPCYSALSSGARAVMLLEAPIAPLTVAAAVTALPGVLTGLTLSDPRASVWDLGRLAGWHLEWADEAFSSAVVGDDTGSAVFRFDEYARITDIKSTLTGTVPPS